MNLIGVLVRLDRQRVPIFATAHIQELPMPSSLRCVAFFSVFSLVAAAGWLSGSNSAIAGEDEPNKPCTATKFETKEVQAACEQGGQKAAKDLMKKVVAHSKEAGKPVKCKGCHENMKTYEFTAKALTEFKGLLAEMNAPAAPPAAAPAPAPAPAKPAKPAK